jgi:hypothetical protein
VNIQNCRKNGSEDRALAHLHIININATMNNHINP